MRAMKARVFATPEEEDRVYLTLHQESEGEVLLMLVDSRTGKLIENTEILRICAGDDGKLHICKIVGRQSIKAVTSKFQMELGTVKVT